MIIRPDFLEHWKTVALCGALNDDAAPLLLIRLWSHCQNARSDRIAEGSPQKLKAICRWKGDPLQLWAGMTSAGWVHMDGTDMVATGWRENNQTLFNSWLAGARGGRPRKVETPPLSPPPSPPAGETHGFTENNPRVMAVSATNEGPEKPTGFPEKTHGKPIREEKRREEGIPPPLRGAPQPDTQTHPGTGPELPGLDAPRRNAKNQGFKGWTKEQFRASVAEANADGLLREAEAEEFCAYWFEPSQTGRERFKLEATWDTRRRMQTALRVVYAKNREQQKPRYRGPNLG